MFALTAEKVKSQDFTGTLRVSFGETVK
jgi:hypothetical protein